MEQEGEFKIPEELGGGRKVHFFCGRQGGEFLSGCLFESGGRENGAGMTAEKSFFRAAGRENTGLRKRRSQNGRPIGEDVGEGGPTIIW